MPDQEDGGRRVGREFLVKVLFSIHGEYMKEIVGHAISSREEKRAFNKDVAPAVISSEMIAMLKECTFASRKRGRATGIFAA